MLLFDDKFLVANVPINTQIFKLFSNIISSKQNLDLNFQSNYFYSQSFIDNYNQQIMVAPLNSSALLKPIIDMSYYYKITPVRKLLINLFRIYKI